MKKERTKTLFFLPSEKLNFKPIISDCCSDKIILSDLHFDQIGAKLFWPLFQIIVLLREYSVALKIETQGTEEKTEGHFY